jgi:hypothetical protein
MGLSHERVREGDAVVCGGERPPRSHIENTTMKSQVRSIMEARALCASHDIAVSTHRFRLTHHPEAALRTFNTSAGGRGEIATRDDRLGILCRRADHGRETTGRGEPGVDRHGRGRTAVGPHFEWLVRVA